jgi:hypothetical protein
MSTPGSLEDELARRIEFLREQTAEADRTIEHLRRLALTGEVVGQTTRSGDFAPPADLVQLKRDLVAAEQQARADYLKVTGRRYEPVTERKAPPTRTHRQPLGVVSEEQIKELRTQFSRPKAVLDLEPGGSLLAENDRLMRNRDKKLAEQIAAIGARLAEHKSVARDAFGRAQGMG